MIFLAAFVARSATIAESFSALYHMATFKKLGREIQSNTWNFHDATYKKAKMGTHASHIGSN